MVEMYGKRFQKNTSIKQNIIFRSEDIKIRIVKLVRIAYGRIFSLSSVIKRVQCTKYFS